MHYPRLTNGFAKTLENHAATVALYFMYYNFARVHQTLRVTPAMESGISDHVWSIEEIVGDGLGENHGRARNPNHCGSCDMGGLLATAPNDADLFNGPAGGSGPPKGSHVNAGGKPTTSTRIDPFARYHRKSS
jgi:hypothetical protein